MHPVLEDHLDGFEEGGVVVEDGGVLGEASHGLRKGEGREGVGCEGGGDPSVAAGSYFFVTLLRFLEPS